VNRAETQAGQSPAGSLGGVRITVVIPNWNGRKFLRPCLGSLRRQSFENFETVLVDNGSTDGSLEFAARDFPEVRTVSLEENRGFSAAVNAGIEASGSEFVALLNNDTEQEPGWLEALVRAAEEHPEAGFFASKLVAFQDRKVLDGAGDALRRSGLPYRIGHGERDRGQYEEPVYVFGACAAAALYRRSMLEEIGLFDEDFFAYCEDADLSFRAQLAGYRCLYVPGAIVYHMGNATTGGRRSETATRLGTRNSLSLLIKNLPALLIARTTPFILAGQLSRLLSMAAGSSLRPHLIGLSEALRLLPRMLRKRRKIQGLRRVPTSYVRRLLKDSARAADVSLLRLLWDRLLRKRGR
jgi:GT2 family glycosyltransferase